MIVDRSQAFLFNLVYNLTRIYHVTLSADSNQGTFSEQRAEKMNSKLLKSLRIRCDRHGTDWSSHVEPIHCLLIVRFPVSILNIAPLCYIMAKTWSQALIRLLHTNSNSSPDIISTHAEIPESLYAKLHEINAQAAAQFYHDQKAKPHKYVVGDLSSTRRETHGKIRRPWQGPYKILQQCQNGFLYILESVKTHKE